MQPAGLEGPRALGLRPPGHRLSLLSLLWVLLLVPSLWVTCTQITPSPISAPTTPEASSAMTTSGAPNDTAASVVTSDPRLREQALALMRQFPLVDGCVCAGVRQWGLSYTTEEHPSTHTHTHLPLLPYTGTPPLSLWPHCLWDCPVWRPCSHSDHNISSHNDLPLLLREHFQNKLQDVNLRNFTRGQTNLDKLRDGLVGAQVTQNVGNVGVTET